MTNLFNRSDQHKKPKMARFNLGLLKLLCLTFFCLYARFAHAAELDAAFIEGFNKMSTTCQEKVFPITSGGDKDEWTTCTIYDPVNQFIIVGGNTTSDNYAPQTNDWGFLYAVDTYGNWRWGKFYYNNGSSVNTVNSCQMITI